jgi:translocation and assembly module TamB
MSKATQQITVPVPRRSRRRFLLCAAGMVVALTAIVAAVWLWASSAEFENLARKRIVAQLETATGGRVEIRSFHWRLTDLEAEAGGVVIHGLEDPWEAPYAQLDSLRVRVSVLGFLSPRILLRDLEAIKPQFHLIIYPNQTTNQPHPGNPKKLEKPVLDTLFDLQAGHIAVEQGTIDIDNRAAAFDSMPRYLPLDFQANDASLVLKYVPAQGSNPESYHIETGVRDLILLRGGNSPSAPPALHAYLQASLDLTRNAAYLRSMRITARTRATKDRVLDISGTLSDFTHARWQGRVVGELDMRLLNPIFGYPFTPDGVTRMDLVGAGDMGEFRFDGPMHVDDGAFVAPGINARNLEVDTRVHADPTQLHFTGMTVRFEEGGQAEGDLELDQWLPHLVGQAVLKAVEPPSVRANPPGVTKPKHFWNRRKSVTPPAPPPNARNILVKLPPQVITVHGKITSKFENVELDTILDMVGQDPFDRLGVNALLSGPATAEWVNGDVNTLVVASTLDVSPTSQPIAGEAPANGVIDATYTQRDGAVDLRRLDLSLPGSEAHAHGRLGAFPLTSQTAMSVDFRSTDLGEFDTVLRALGLERNGKTGTAALPVALSGQAEFHGTWSGSMVSPRLAGVLKATQLAVELPPNPKDPAHAPQFVRWDSVEADGSYTAERIAILHGQLSRGQSQITLDGTLSAANAGGATRGDEMPAFDSDSLLHAHVKATKVGVGDLLPLMGVQAPVTGTLDADIETDGPMGTLGGSGWVELDDAIVYGEPVARARAQGTFANKLVKLTSITLSNKAGSLSGSGIYDLRSRHFQAEAHGAGIDFAKIESFSAEGDTVTGKLAFSTTASGTLEEPSLEGQATLAGLAVDGQAMGALEATAHTVNRDLIYDVTSRMEAAQLTLHGQTGLHGDFPTQAKLDFSRFNIGEILMLAHLGGIKGESSLSGTATVQGPLAHVDQLQGEARLQSMAVTVAGVHLKSEGGVHATLSNARVVLDPLHITGEETDLHAEGSLGLKDTKKLDFAASGSINLKLAETLDSDLTAGGTTTFQVEAHGPLANPGLRGTIDFNNGSLSLEDLPNGLSQLHGRLEFNQNRLEVRSLTAMTGGGLLSLGGYLAYQHGLYADLSVTGRGIRIRYPQGVSSLADTTLHMQGTQNSLLLSGNVLLTRFTVSPEMDIAALAAQASAVQPVAPPDAPSNHIRLDVRIQSSPQLNFQNAYAKLAGDVDLRLRGTLASPSLLGRISITEGNATIAGTRYELQRGDILFTNPVRIQPTIDLNATARVEDHDITLGLHGTLDKLGISYRSDPPLPEADVVALLALGRTQSEQGIYTQQQEQSVGMGPSTDVLLGGALNATVSSRVQKLFGAGSVKVDPSYLGALGNSTTRLTVEEQLGKNVTLIYATNVDTSAQQLLQAEIAINRHVSLLVARDESGVFSMVVKASRRYR